VRKLVFNDKKCCILILKNLTSVFRLKKASKMKQNMHMLTTTVSHELRMPLELVISIYRIMLSHTTDPHFIELIKVVQSSNQILLFRVNDLLDSSTMEKGAFTKNLKVFDLVKSVEEVVQINSQQALFREVSLKVRKINMVPKYMFTDNTRFQQVLMNYLGNGIKFSQGGEIEITVEVDKR